LDLYRLLEDWVLVSQKVEMDAIDEMCVVIKEHIENETKIQDELRIEYMNFTVDKSVLNYITPPPPKFPPFEEIRDDRFTIPQLQCFIEEFEVLEQVNNNNPKLAINYLYQVFNVRQNCSKSFRGIRSGLPAFWHEMSMYNFTNMIRNLDPDNTGKVNWRQLMSYVVLTTSPLLDDVESKKLLAVADEDGLIDKEHFVKVPMWFDKTESSVDRPRHIEFARTDMIKETLFRINCEV